MGRNAGRNVNVKMGPSVTVLMGAAHALENGKEFIVMRVSTRKLMLTRCGSSLNCDKDDISNVVK